MRGRNRGSKGPNPLTRSYESNGPDVKVRGTAQHIAEKYTQLARDAQSSGDPVAAENYLQHAEHYFRIILTAQEQLRQQFGTTFQRPFDDEDEDGDEFNGGYGQPGQGGGYGAPGDDMDIGSQPQPYTGGFEARQGGDEGRRERFDRGPRPDRGDRPDRQDRGDRPDRGDRQERGERQDRGDRPDRGDRSDRAERPDGQPRFDRGPRQDRRERFRDRERDQQPRGEFQPREPRPERVEAQGEAPEGFAPRREERRDDRREGRRERRPEAPVEEAGLPAFLTNPVRAAPVAEAPEAAPAPAPEAEAAEAPRPRRRRRTTRVDEAPDSGAETRDTTPVE